jgi:tyrosyl-DNA phosphodiesterase 1
MHLFYTLSFLRFRDSAKTQGQWISSLIKLKSSNSVKGPNFSFETDLCSYIHQYGKDLASLKTLLSTYDFSHEKATIIASVPGRHKNSLWGHLKMARVLSDKVPVSPGCVKESSLVMQFSSVGSLGGDDKWLVHEFGSSLSSNLTVKESANPSKPTIKLVFPTSEQVRTRYVSRFSFEFIYFLFWL